DAYPDSIAEKQALACVGEGVLMDLYSRFFQQYDQHEGQVSMTRDIVSYPSAYQNCQTSSNPLLRNHIIAIIHESDAMTVDASERRSEFGENDTLAAVVTEVTEADMLIIISDIEGLYDSNPHTDSEAKLIPYVGEISDEILAMAGGAGSVFSTGGMETKLNAA